MAQARFKQLVDTFAADIREGRLPPGTRLPTHRKLAAQQRIALARVGGREVDTEDDVLDEAAAAGARC